jgi:hypothetical protein
MAIISKSKQFVYIPFLGESNLITVKNNDVGTPVADQVWPFFIDLGSASPAPGGVHYIPKTDDGDDGNLPSGGAVDSYTVKEPNGRRGNMITHMELVGEGANDDGEQPNFLFAVAIPAGMAPGATSPLLDKKYSLSNQPGSESFDYTKFLPLVCAKPCLSLFGGALPGSYSGYEPPTGRFPTTPTAEPFEGGGVSGVFMYIPVGFYPSFGTILDDVFSPSDDVTDLTLVDQPQFGILLISAQFDSDIGSGCLTVDFSHTVAN